MTDIVIDMQQYYIDIHKDLHDMQDNSIQQLNNNQIELTSHFETCFEQHNKVLDAQQQTIDHLDDLQGKTTLLQQETVESQNQVKRMYEWQHELLSQTQNQIQHIANFSENAYAHLMVMMKKILDALDDLYNVDLQIFMQYLSIQSYSFHLAWILIIYLITIPTICNEMRIWLFFCVFVSFFIERCAFNEEIVLWYDSFQSLSSRINIIPFSKLIRYVTIVSSMIFYLYSVLNFKDIQKENLMLLSQINNRIQSPHRTRNTIHLTSLKCSSPFKSPRNTRGFVFKRPQYLYNK